MLEAFGTARVLGISRDCFLAHIVSGKGVLVLERWSGCQESSSAV